MNSTKFMSKVAAVAARPSVRSMSSTANVWVDKNTRVICQGFTGKQVGDKDNALVYENIVGWP